MFKCQRKIIRSINAVVTIISAIIMNTVGVTISIDTSHMRCISTIYHVSNSFSHTDKRNSTCSSDSSTITPSISDNKMELAHNCNKWKSGLVYLMDPCIEDCEHQLTKCLHLFLTVTAHHFLLYFFVYLYIIFISNGKCSGQ